MTIKKTVAGIGIGILFIFLLLLIYGTAVEPYWLEETTPEFAGIPNLPAGWVGQKVACIGDFQIGMWMDNDDTVEEAIRTIVQEKASLALIIGDFIYHAEEDQDDIREAVQILKPLGDAAIPTYAVLGNHDYSLKKPDGNPNPGKAKYLEKQLEDIGVKVLRNRAVSLGTAPPKDRGAGESRHQRKKENLPLYLIGVGSHWMGLDHPDKPLREIPAEAPRLVIMHHPDSFALFPAHTAPLALAGHTHGGQIRIPGTRNWSWLTFVKQDEVHADGWISDFGRPGNRLYVNRGIGFSKLPVRINCRPELSWFILSESISEK